MPVDPAVQGMLDLLASLDRPRMSAGTPERARRAFRTLTVDLRRPEAVVPVAAVEDRTVDAGTGPLTLRVYRPEGAAGGAPVPTIVFLHGGGFVIGDLDTHDNQCRWICREVGAVVVSADYRLAPEHPFPAAVADALAVTRWVADQVDGFGGDPARLVVAGDSAGGNLAAVVAQVCRDAGGPPIAAQLLLYPAVDLAPGTRERNPSRVTNGDGYFLTSDDMRWFEAHYSRSVEDRRDPRLSPIFGDLAGLPATVLVTAEFDPLRDEGEAYARALREAGVEVRSRCWNGLIHGFFDLAALSPACTEAVRDTCAAVRELLAGA